MLRHISILFILFSIIYGLSLDQSHIKFKAQHRFDLKQMVIDQSNQRMLLQEDELHHIRITGSFPQNSGDVNIQHFKKQFNIAAFYLSRSIKTKKFTNKFIKVQDLEINGPGEKCFHLNVPQKYIDIGLNPNLTDLQISASFNQTVKNVAHKFCFMANGRFMIVFVEFNPQIFVGQENDQFQLFINIHVYSLWRSLASNYVFLFYTDLLRDTVQKVQNFIRKENGRYYLISPNVLNFVQNYFGCKDGKTGALLRADFDITSQQQQIIVDEGVYQDDISSQQTRASHVKITPLAFNILKDSNLWEYVDTETYAQKSTYGKGRGCQFAKGNYRPYPQYCNKSQILKNSCNMHYTLYGLCKNSGSFQQGTRVFCKYSMVPQSAKVGESFGYHSGCFNTKNGIQSYCLSAKCINNLKQIEVTIPQGNYQEKFICQNSNQQFYSKILRKTVVCPNIDTFCLNEQCQDWCKKEGVCINGVCMGLICPIQNCSFCSYDRESYQCQQCAYGFYLLNNTCLKTCPSKYFIKDNICLPCSSNCQDCFQKSTKCLSCPQNYNWQAYTCKEANLKVGSNSAVDQSQSNAQPDDGKVSMVFPIVLLCLLIPAIIVIVILSAFCIYIKCFSKAQNNNSPVSDLGSQKNIINQSAENNI